VTLLIWEIWQEERKERREKRAAARDDTP